MAGDEKKMHHVNDDPDVQVLSGAENSVDDEKRVRRKIDCVILPMMCTVYFLQYLDKLSLGYAAVFGLIEDLGLQGSQYSWCTSIFYFGQLVAEGPFIYLMGRLPLTRFIAVTIILWGAVCMCLAAPTNFAGFAAVRVLLGVTEGAVSPAFVTITSIWYKKEDHALRVGIWGGMNPLAQVIGSLLMYGIGKIHHPSIEPWRILFLLCGALTSVFGVVFYIAMPSTPQKAWFLTPREREIVLERMQRDREGGDKVKFSWAQVRETLFDTKAWFILLLGFIASMPGAVIFFGTILINGLNYDKFQTMLLTAPSGAISLGMLAVAMIGCSILPKYRCLVLILVTIVPLVGNILLLKLPLSATWGLVASSWLASCNPGILVMIMSLSASNVKGNTKRAIVNTYFFIGLCVGCIAGPQLWEPSAAPRFFSGVTMGLSCWKRDREQGVDSGPVTAYAGEDLTDKEDVLFRYIY
ncbi:hypothetical protein SI65_00673 [Aspergillus cristatus]|uniref:Major facilitator superfamily (MFS) profile domain-containing protein n=1 Tax=Aspergillus cristatus TaxID=573508 RepID=A0A1E3BQ32_ASPCR|nr:hypothetical protein SI65_00673 [Aspergillus cristatus]